MKNSNRTRINGQIRVDKVRLINSDGEMLGIVTIDAAMKKAIEQELDLIEVSPNAEPPVCKIMNYGKYKYEIGKKIQEAKKKQKVVETKEIKIRPNIAIGDYTIKLRKAVEFLKNGDKVRVSLAFKGREMSHNEVGFALMKKFKEDILDHGKVELEPKMEGRQIFMVIVPK